MGAALRHPAFATIITLLVIVTGGVGSIFSNEIRNAFPFYWGRGQWSWEAFSFWALALVSSLAFFCRERSVTHEQQRVQDLTLQRAREFERLIRTLPPANFLALFSGFFGAAHKVVEAAFGDPKPIPKERPIVEQSARHLLRMIATLAQKFDGDRPDVEYAANVMLFKSSASLSDAEAREIKSHLLFCDEAVSVAELKGVLQLDLQLSTTAADDTAAPDPKMRPIALPIPWTVKNGERYRVLPGAPLAFVEREPDLYTDTSTLGQWCAEKGDFTRDVIKQVAGFFENSPASSFMSVPLFSIGDDGSDKDDEDPFAILNIHSGLQRLLHERGEPLIHFMSILRPFQIFLIQLLICLRSETSPVMLPTKATAGT